VTVGVVAVERGSHVSAAESAQERFAQLYAVMYRPLTAYCFRLVGDQSTAADVAQEAFTRLFARVITVRDPRAWLYLVATNLCRDVWRHNEKQRALVERAGQVSETTSAAHDMGLRDLVERLPTRLREVVVLHYYADLPVAEVARALRKPVGTVKRRLLEARALLADDVRTSS
jgi:RNA polymerase sigma factor (sigma-70 family)